MVSQALAINPNNSTDTHFGWSETDVLFRNSRIFKRHKRFLFRQVLAAGGYHDTYFARNYRVNGFLNVFVFQQVEKRLPRLFNMVIIEIY
ncbi:hypothetical protein Y032_0017g3450 [Ancylostoma ceylanicum]|uniref:Uncharacterized protein n=1 Tax=Ancylostoma ceylanicum TaxID=53326 RepID=A0A016V6J1_9BILA|nr:hypothetical protein Y032_0017g3450 [Ancylostoma ceylanicum]